MQRQIDVNYSTSAVGRERDLAAAFSTSATSVISDNLDRMIGAIGVRPFHKVERPMVGVALTVKVAPGDNLFIHRALDLIQAGDVLVVDGFGDERRALMGEIMTRVAELRGAAGVVIDGAVRDAGPIGRSNFPVFARTAIHLGPYKNGPGTINSTVSIGGMIVNPGDIVVGDEDGVVAFPPSIAEDLLTAVQEQEAKEVAVLEGIKAGIYEGGYAR